MNNENRRAVPQKNGIEFLFELEKFGIKMDLTNILGLMEFAGDPHRRLKVVHVAGTNGKGSTCAMLASVLMSNGHKVGLYTSPHILSFTERFKINGVQITEERAASLSDYFREEAIGLRATFFETTTAMMFKYFADEGVDVAVIETGLGGRLDATNIVDPFVSVITGIGLDHTDILGNTLEKIASEKAGIIKPGRPAVVNVSGPSLRKVFSDAAASRNSQLSFVEDIAFAENVHAGIEGCDFDATVFGQKLDSLKVGMGGKHQVSNALTALAALHVMESGGVRVSKEAVYAGLSGVKKNTGHRGRLDVVSKVPLIILDVAHNPHGIEALLESLKVIPGSRKGVLLFAAMKDKDASSMLNRLRERFPRVILTQLQTGRSLGIADLKYLSDSVKLQSQIFDDSSEAFRAALSQTDNDSFLLVTGSHYLAGEVLPLIQKSTTNFEVQ